MIATVKKMSTYLFLITSACTSIYPATKPILSDMHTPAVQETMDPAQQLTQMSNRIHPAFKQPPFDLLITYFLHEYKIPALTQETKKSVHVRTHLLEEIVLIFTDNLYRAKAKKNDRNFFGYEFIVTFKTIIITLDTFLAHEPRIVAGLLLKAPQICFMRLMTLLFGYFTHHELKILNQFFKKKYEDYCTKELQKIDAAIISQGIYKKALPHTCYSCNKELMYNHGLMVDHKIHARIKPYDATKSKKMYECIPCGKNFQNSSNYRQHIKRKCHLKALE